MTQSVHSTLSSKSSSAAAASSIFIIKRQFSSNEDTKIHTIGDKEYDDLKQIRLVQLPSHKNNQKPTTLASICVKRNIIFGPKLIHLNDKGFVKTLSPLLKQAFDQASVEGDQPQGLAALDGLAHYVTLAMQEDGPIVSPILEQLKKEAAQHQQQQQLILQESQSSPATYTDDGSERASVQDAQLVLEAVYSVATQIPRQNHSVVGMGTYGCKEGLVHACQGICTV
eukprot:scaffold2090_cov151-Chaetoceros_neogracile.AAC.3